MKKFLLLLLILAATKNVFAQSLRGRYIQFSHLNGFTYSYSIRIYSNDSSVSSLIVSLGDATIDTLENTGLPQTGTICYSEFSFAGHTFPGLGTYVVSVSAHYLMDSISNIQFAAMQPLYLEDSLVILDPVFFGYDSSPIILNSSVGYATVQQTFEYNPNAYDPDGDSLSFSLVPYFASGYTFPSATDSISINKITGELIWDKPIEEGNYAIAILITEFRLGVIIGTQYVVLMIPVDNSLAVNSIASENTSTIFPNPTSNQTTITYNLPHQSQSTLSILNLQGQKISETKLNPQQHQFTLDVSQFPSGVYILELLSNDGVIAKKLMKE